MTKITDLTKNHSGKWYEVLTLCKENDPLEEPAMIAKFTSKHDAVFFGNKYPELWAGVVEVIIR